VRVVFTDPQVAAVGLTAAGARDRGLDVDILSYDIGAVAGGALLGKGVTGTAQLVADRVTRTIVGATFTGPGVGEMLHAATIAIVSGVTLDQLWHAIPAFPTLSEALIACHHTATGAPDQPGSSVPTAHTAVRSHAYTPTTCRRARSACRTTRMSASSTCAAIASHTSTGTPRRVMSGCTPGTMAWSTAPSEVTATPRGRISAIDRNAGAASPRFLVVVTATTSGFAGRSTGGSTTARRSADAVHPRPNAQE
jgi:hypothetical protein